MNILSSIIFESADDYHAKSKSGEYLSSHMLADFRKCPKLYEKKIAGVKECPQCYAIIHAALRICPECKHEFPEPKANIEKAAGDKAILSGEITDTDYQVNSVEYAVHRKRGAPDNALKTMRVDYSKKSANGYVLSMMAGHGKNLRSDGRNAQTKNYRIPQKRP